MIISFANAQEEYNQYVKNLKATAVDGKVYLSWTTKAGFTCTDIHIEVSNDSLGTYEKRGTYFGICGDASERDYSYILNNPIPNKLNYIKLQLGNIGKSHIISVFVLNLQESILVLPHPVTKNSSLYFYNNLKEQVQIDFYNLQGELVSSILTQNNQISLASAALPKGMVIYQIATDNKILHRGRLMVAATF
jgi:hypothetical protein